MTKINIKVAAAMGMAQGSDMAAGRWGRKSKGVR
jgi:hypothetical protein